MENSKQFLHDNNILARISFKDGQAHTVKLVKDKIDQIPDDQNKGRMIDGVKYMVTENGEPKTFFTSSVGLIQKLAECKEEAEVTIQMKSKKGPKGYISFFEVREAGSEEIPTIEENYEGEQSFHEQLNG